MNYLSKNKMMASSLVIALSLTGVFSGVLPAAAEQVVKAQHKKIGYVDLIAAGAMQKRFYNYFTAGADALGWEVILEDGAGDPTKSNTAAVNLLNQGIDALVVSCADTAPMRQSLLLAEEKGVPAIQIGCPMSDDSLWDASYPIDDDTVGRTLGEYIATQLPEGSEVGILGDTVIIAGQVRTNAMKESLSGLNMKIVGEQSVDLADIAGSSREITSAYLTANPDLKAILAIYDFFAPAAGNTILSAGKGDQVSVYSFYADAVNAPYMVTENSPLKAVADGPVENVSLIAIDQLLNHFEKGEAFDGSAVKSMEVKYEIFTKDNLPTLSEGYLTPYPVETYLADYVAKWQAAYGAN